MIRQNLHTHTVFDDGKNTPKEMCAAALAAGLTSLGFSCHSVLPYDNDWSLAPERVPDYLAAVREAKNAFMGRLAVYSGIELDGISSHSVQDFDYVIGSLHHIQFGGEYPSIDDTAAITRDILERYFGGDRDAMAAAYFAQYADLAADADVDVVGHFDLLSKFDETDGIFDPAAPAYRDSAMAALEALCGADKIFEVNTGAMAKGYRTAPYPSLFFLRELKARRARLIVSSDAHTADAVAFAFRKTEARLAALGFTELWEFDGRQFVPVPLSDI